MGNLTVHQKLNDLLNENCETHLVVLPAIMRRTKRSGNRYSDTKACMVLFAINNLTGFIRAGRDGKTITNVDIAPEFKTTAKDISERIGGEYSDYVIVSALKRLECFLYLSFDYCRVNGKTEITIRLNVSRILEVASSVNVWEGVENEQA